MIKSVYQKYISTSARVGYAPPFWKRAQVQGLKESRLTIRGDIYRIKWLCGILSLYNVIRCQCSSIVLIAIQFSFAKKYVLAYIQMYMYQVRSTFVEGYKCITYNAPSWYQHLNHTIKSKGCLAKCTASFYLIRPQFWRYLVPMHLRPEVQTTLIFLHMLYTGKAKNTFESTMGWLKVW